MDISTIDKKKQTASQKLVINIYDFVSVLITAVVTIAILFTFIFRVVGVSGSSMVPTLHDKDWLIVTAFDAKPKYGQVVIITQPNAFNEPIVKRVIATEGQEVDINFKKGEVYVDGNLLEEDYINDKTHDFEGVNFPLTVPEGHVFVMGDNRNASTDSRSEMIGFIDEDYIVGVAKLKLFSIDETTGKYKINPLSEWIIH